MPVPVAVLAFTSAAFIAFAAALLYALRGRRVDDHPICRKCGFDLFGRPDGATRCSECGADLARRRATRIGRRARRRGLTRVAGTGVLLCAVALSGVGWLQLRGVDLQRHKPVWWLAREAGSRQPGTRDAALAELARRVADGKITNLSDAQLASLLDRAFAHQADTSQTWVPGWGLLIEAAHDAGRLSDDRWDRYRVQGFALRLKVRDVIRRGDPIPIEFWADPPRLGTPPVIRSTMGVQFPGAVADLAPELNVSGLTLPEAKHGPATLGLDWRASPALLGSAIYEPPASAFAALADGPQSAQISCLVSLAEHSRPSVILPKLRKRPINLVLRASWRLVPAAAQTVATTIDERRRGLIERSVSVRSADLDGTENLTLKLDCPSLSLPLAFMVYVRQGDREWPVGLATSETGRYPEPYVSARCPGLAPGTAELILRPDPDAAVRTTGITMIWGDEIRIAPVYVRRVGFATTRQVDRESR